MKEIGIYVHIPFCKRKCKYCDFISFSDKLNIDEYIKSIIYEIENIEKKNEIFMQNKCEEINLKDLVVDSIYFGGGTPSYIKEEYIEDILETLRKKFQIKNNAEITIEINPGTADEAKIRKYKEIGINRVSIGLQSANNKILELIGRVHTYEEFLYTYNLCKKYDLNNINVDLMLALPEQTEEDLKDSLIKVINLNPSHISLYSLILEEGTELENLVTSNEIKLPSEDIERNMYWKTKKILESNKYFQYEISNFSKKGKESRHNLNCWNQGQYLGFGLSAHSYINNIRFSNISDFNIFLENISKNLLDKNIEIQEIQSKEKMMKEFMMIGLRKIEGISISKFEQKFSINPLFYFRFEIEDLTKKQLLEVDLDYIKLTKKGLDFANMVFESFI